MQIAARGFPAVTRSSKKMIKTTKMLIAQRFRNFVVDRVKPVVYKLSESVLRQWGIPQILPPAKNIYRNLKSSISHY